MSFNGGAHWQDLTQPESFRYPECNSCQNSKSCQLHLHGPSSWHYGAGAPSSRGAACLTARYKGTLPLAPPAEFTAGCICVSVHRAVLSVALLESCCVKEMTS